MLRRILCLALAAVMLAAIAPAALADGGEASPIVADALAPFAVADGEIAVPLGTSGNELLACFADKFDLSLAAADGSALSLTEAIATGATVSRGGESVVAIVPGDVNGDAVINVRDAIAAMRVTLGAADGVFASAADVNADGAVNSRDVIKLMRSLVGWDEALFVREARTAEYEDEALTMYFDSAMHRISRDDPSTRGDAEGIMRSAKNELEDIQIVLASAEARSGLTLEVGSPTSASGAELEYEVRYGYYYQGAMFYQLKGGDWHIYDEGWWADPYPKLRGAFDINANESQTFLVKVDIPADAEAGWYAAPVVVRDGEGREIKRSLFRLYVWDFALDEEPALDTLFLTDPNGILRFAFQKEYEVDLDTWQETYDNEWFEYNLHNRLSDYHIPYDILDDRADKYMNDPRVTAFVSGGGIKDFDWENQSDREHLRAVYDKLETNETWKQKAYIYTVDEPGSDVARVKNQWENAKSVLGDTYFQTILPGPSTMIEDMWDWCNAFCPNIDLFLRNAPNDVKKANPDLYPTYGKYLVNMREYLKYGNFQERYDKLRERGDNMWCYICCSPEFPYANFFNSYQGSWQRMVLWQTYFIHSDGLLYWSTVFWNVAEHTTALINMRRTGSGDGLLLYPGFFWDEGLVPVPSVRYEYVRDGIEDYQYLKQLERELGRDEAMTYVNRLCVGILTFSEDYKEMIAVRDELGFALEGLACKVADQ